LKIFIKFNFALIKFVTFLGIAYHCYLAKNTEAVDAVHKKHPNPFILMTECCQNFRKNTDPFTPSTLGDWDHARDYAHNVMNVSNFN
jgi:hypothetical protein